MLPKPRFLIFILTTACNLNCVYCYRGGNRRRQVMPREAAEKLLHCAAGDDRPFHVQITGGEPTLEPKLIEWLASAIRRAQMPATIALQTNGTLLDSCLAKMCDRYDIQVGISLDGPVNVQQKLRGGAASTLNGIQLLADYGVPFRITTVVSDQNVSDLGRLVLMLGGFPNVRGIALDLLVKRGRAERDGGAAPAAPQALQYGVASMIKMLEQVNRRRFYPIHFRELETVRRSLEQPRHRPFCNACRGESLALSPDGRLYPCGQTAGDPAFDCGTLDQPSVERLQRLGRYTLAGSACGGCPLESGCPGECPSRLYYNGPAAVTLACTLYQTLARHLLGKQTAADVLYAINPAG